MRLLSILICAGLVTLAVAGFAGAQVSTQTYKGTATGLDGKFRYGAVTVKRRDGKVTFVEIKAVTANCSGQALLRTIVFSPASRSIRILSGSSKINRGVMKVVFLPVKSVPDARTTIRIVFSGRTATGSFNEADICTDRGKFTAKR